MKRKEGSAPARTPKATVVRFLSRADQLHARGIRNFGRWKMNTSAYTHPDPEERARLQHEQAQDAQDDRDWNRRHGPITGGARILPWRYEHAGERKESLDIHRRDHQVTQ
jgi:hypothetical protein